MTIPSVRSAESHNNLRLRTYIFLGLVALSVILLLLKFWIAKFPVVQNVTDLSVMSSTYQQLEASAGIRGTHFADLASHIDFNYRGRMSKEQVTHYLGRGQTVQAAPGFDVLVYPYNRFGREDWAVWVFFDNGVFSHCGWNQYPAPSSRPTTGP